MSVIRDVLRTIGTVLGAGTLLVPASVTTTGASGAVALLVVAATLLAWAILLSAAGGTRQAGVAGLVSTGLGPRAARVVHGLYFAGFSVGQAALATAAGRFAGSGATAAVVSFAVLGCAAALSAAGVTLSPLARDCRLWATLALVLVWWSHTGVLSLHDDGPFPGGPVLVVLPILFSWVGLEGSVPSPHPRRARDVVTTLLGIVCCAALYFVLLLPAARPPAGAASAPGRGAGWIAAIVLAAYCLTNLRSAGSHWADLLSGHTNRAPGGSTAPRKGVMAAAALAAATLIAATVLHWSVATVLMGPGAATAALYLLLTASAGRQVFRTG